jgi:hypothetical protein
MGKGNERSRKGSAVRARSGSGHRSKDVQGSVRPDASVVPSRAGAEVDHRRTVGGVRNKEVEAAKGRGLTAAAVGDPLDIRFIPTSWAPSSVQLRRVKAAIAEVASTPDDEVVLLAAAMRTAGTLRFRQQRRPVQARQYQSSYLKFRGVTTSLAGCLRAIQRVDLGNLRDLYVASESPDNDDAIRGLKDLRALAESTLPILQRCARKLQPRKSTGRTGPPTDQAQHELVWTLAHWWLTQFGRLPSQTPGGRFHRYVDAVAGNFAGMETTSAEVLRAVLRTMRASWDRGVLTSYRGSVSWNPRTTSP